MIKNSDGNIIDSIEIVVEQSVSCDRMPMKIHSPINSFMKLINQKVLNQP